MYFLGWPNFLTENVLILLVPHIHLRFKHILESIHLKLYIAHRQWWGGRIKLEPLLDRGKVISRKRIPRHLRGGRLTFSYSRPRYDTIGVDSWKLILIISTSQKPRLSRGEETTVGWRSGEFDSSGQHESEVLGRTTEASCHQLELCSASGVRIGIPF